MENLIVERSPLGLAEQISTRIAFFIAGVGVAGWAPLVPYAKARMNLEESTLGLLLLCLGLGSVFTMPLTSMLAARFGCRVVISVAAVFIAISLALLAVVPTPLSLAFSLFVFGASVGSLDVAVNIQAIIVEKASGRSLMSGFHGLFSLGGIIGAACVSGVLALGFSPFIAASCISAAILALIAACSKNLLDYGSESHEPLFVLPHGKVVLVGIFCFIVFLAEGSMLDWSALFLTSRRGVDPTLAGLGYAAFAVTMTLGRLSGDRIVEALGNRTILLWGGLLAAVGFLLAALCPSPYLAILGFALVGIGASNIVPVLFKTAGQQKAMPAGLAISAITTIGYAGSLSGPAGIGFIARVSSLESAFLIIAALLCLVAVSSRQVA